MMERDPVDVALSWATTNEKEGQILVMGMANDQKSGRNLVRGRLILLFQRADGISRCYGPRRKPM